ncbi:MAG: efflux transporter outer membrane subunit [bacterium]|nr:efflux transporter outer membrane subunit [bacterium]
MTRAVSLVTALAAVLLAGCAVGPDYERPDLEAPPPVEWKAATMDDALPSGDGSGASWRWWEEFEDVTLNALVDSALVRNHELAQAVASVLEARAAAGGAESARWPSIEIGGTATRSKSSEQQLSFGPLYTNSFAATATMRYELDLWGQLSRGKEAAVADLLASEQNRRTVVQTLIADVVRTWLQIHELRQQVALTERTVDSFASSLATVQERYRRGLVSALDLHLAGQNLSSARAQLPAFQEQLVAARRRLEILVGRYPAGELVASDAEAMNDGSTTAMPEPLAPVPAGLPSELLDRRPDLLAAEAQLAANTARIGQAKAALYPRIALTAEGGSKSREFEDLFTSASDAWSLVGNLVMPLINRGATQAQIKAAEARSARAAAAYQAAVLRAFAEVENALDREVFQSRQEEDLTASADQARRSVHLAEERYRRGLDPLLVTLESQRRLFNAESQLLATQRQRRAARVDLILALGGPWEAATAVATDDNREGAVQ